MFNENFSFLSSTSTSLDLINDYTPNTDSISPFTSRSSSPRPRYGSTSHPQRDTRYDSHRAPRHPSITALTAQLESHVLTSNNTDHTMALSTTTTRRGSLASDTDTYTSPDEGFFDGEYSSPDTPSSASSFSFYDDLDELLDMPQRPSLSLEAQALSSFTQRRRQRQALVRLQCLAKRAPDLAMLLEECHPSGADPVWMAGGSRSRSGSLSATSAGSSRVEKGQNGRVRGTPRMRKRATR